MYVTIGSHFFFPFLPVRCGGRWRVRRQKRKRMGFRTQLHSPRVIAPSGFACISKWSACWWRAAGGNDAGSAGEFRRNLTCPYRTASDRRGICGRTTPEGRCFSAAWPEIAPRPVLCLLFALGISFFWRGRVESVFWQFISVRWKREKSTGSEFFGRRGANQDRSLGSAVKRPITGKSLRESVRSSLLKFNFSII